MATLKVMCARVLTEAVDALALDFTRETGWAVDTTYATVGAIQAKVEAGEGADVLIVSLPVLAKLQKAAALAADAHTALARTSIGVAVREGTASPDISTPEAFVATLRGARTIAFSSPAVGGTAGVYLAGLFERMGLAEMIAAKAMPQQNGGEVARRVAAGEADIGMTLIPEILPIKGARVAGPLPAPLGHDTIYAGVAPTNGASNDAAQAFIALLARPANRPVWDAAGLALPETR